MFKRLTTLFASIELRIIANVAIACPLIIGCGHDCQEVAYQNWKDNGEIAWQTIQRYLDDRNQGIDTTGYFCGPESRLDERGLRVGGSRLVDHVWNFDTSQSTALLVFQVVGDGKEEFFTCEVRLKASFEDTKPRDEPCIVFLARGLEEAKRFIVDPESWENDVRTKFFGD